MQNHGGYSDTYDNFTPDITVEGVESTPLSQYLSLVRLSDQALEKLISYFEETDEKTIVVFFGDHQPNDTVAAPILNLNGMTTKTLTEDQLKLRYEVPYVIWANYDIDAESGKDTSANYLAADVLHYAGISENAYGSYLLELQQNYPVISAMRVLTKDGLDTNSSSLKQELKDYQSLQYYQLFDWKKSECADRSLIRKEMKERKQEFVRMNQTQINETKSKKWCKWLPLLAAFLIPLLISVIICIDHEVYPFGERCLLQVDMYHQYCPFLQSLWIN